MFGWPPRLSDVPVIVPQIGRFLMLVLTRKVGEKIRIGDNIVVTVMKCGSSSTKIAFEAPLEVRILRDELPQKPAEELMALAGL